MMGGEKNNVKVSLRYLADIYHLTPELTADKGDGGGDSGTREA